MYLRNVPLHAHISLVGTRPRVVDLLARRASLVRPREVGDGDEEEGVAGVGDTGEGVVPK